jgi:hypothetical protein
VMSPSAPEKSARNRTGPLFGAPVVVVVVGGAGSCLMTLFGLEVQADVAMRGQRTKMMKARFILSMIKEC